MIISAYGKTQFGPPPPSVRDVRRRLAACIVRAALDETRAMDQLWASLTRETCRPLVLRRHKQFVGEHLAFFFSVAEGFLRQCFKNSTDSFFEELTDVTCVQALTDPSVPMPYGYVGQLPAKRYISYRQAVTTRRMELWRVHPYATIGSLADLSTEHLLTAAAIPRSQEGQVTSVIHDRIKWAGMELVGRL